MYAIIEAGGRQWRVQPGTQLAVHRVGSAVGAVHVFDRVLLARDDGTLKIGQPYVAGAKVLCEVLEQTRGPKVISYKFRRRENYRRIRGHRQELTKLLVKEISL